MTRERLEMSEVPAEDSIDLVERNLGDHLRLAVDRHGDREFVVFTPDTSTGGEREQRWTYRDMLERAEQVARALLERFAPGDRVAIWSANSADWISFEFGAALAGIVFVTVNPALVASELKHVLGQSGAAGIVLTRSWRTNAMLESVEQIKAELPNLREVILLDEWDSFLATADPTTTLPEVDPHQPMMIQYTSGTTGLPKGVVLSHFGCVNNGRLMIPRFELGEQSRWLAVLPLFHVGGSVINTIGALSAGGTLILTDKFDATEAVEAIEREAVTYVAAVPTMLLAMLEVQRQAPRDLSSLRAVMGGGATVPPDMIRSIEEGLGVPFGTMYGSTETSAMVTNSRLDDSLEDKSTTAGPPIPRVSLRITDPKSGQVVPVGEVGSIEVRGFGVMKEYFEMPEETAQAVDPDGWLTTGDLGSVDHRGYLSVRGRLKEMIIRGGENIYPAEIEKVLHDHPAVGLVAVVGAPDDRLGEEVMAFVQLREGASATEEELADFAGTRLARFKVPRRWKLVDDFPLTPSGKVQKHLLETADNVGTRPS